MTRQHTEGIVTQIVLTDAEAERLAEILARGFSPTPALSRALTRLAEPDRQPPRLQWKETAG
ncbi:MAG TPA: hypothetical protein VF173_12240 [Thermoanaerobaculia bacterium]|nr:hypothetical protein [Thermoanaerobaculia bacterium]